MKPENKEPFIIGSDPCNCNEGYIARVHKNGEFRECRLCHFEWFKPKVNESNTV